VSFRRDRLPPAKFFYQLELVKLTRPNSKGYALGRCPFHDSKSGKSLSVNINDGHFHCFGCDAKGGDIIAFLRKLEGYSFEKAARVLGCWDESGKSAKIRTVARRYLVMDYAIDGASHRAEVLDEPKSDRERLRRFYHEAKDRLRELRTGDPGRFPDEEETLWSILADSWELLRSEVEHG
jgi:DNA primase